MTLTENQKKLVLRLHRVMSDWSMRYIPAPAKMLPIVTDTLAEVDRQVEADIALNDALRLRIEDAFDRFEEDVGVPLLLKLPGKKGKEETHGDQPDAGEDDAPPVE